MRKVSRHHYCFILVTPAAGVLLQAGAAELELVTSSPEANGFYGSTGLSGHIPLAYSLLEHRTWQRLNRRRSSWLPQAAREGRGGGTRALRALAARQQLWWARGGAVSLGDAAAAAAVAGAAAAAGDKPALVAAQASSAAAEAAGGSAALAAARRLYEYRRPGWEFHAKGLWVSQQHQRGVSQQQQPGQHGGGAHVPSWAAPAVTLIGSSNFGFRSLHRDLEVRPASACTHAENCHTYEASEVLHQWHVPVRWGAARCIVPRYAQPPSPPPPAPCSACLARAGAICGGHAQRAAAPGNWPTACLSSCAVRGAWAHRQGCLFVHHCHGHTLCPSHPPHVQALGREVASLKQHCQAVEGEAHFLAPGRRGGALACLAVRLLRGFL